MTEYKKLENQPLKFALAEFRFSSVLQISEFIPSIQEALRKTFPIQKHRIDQGINVHSGGFEVNKQDRWAFVSADGRSAVQVSQDNFVYTTSAYPRFEGFSGECKKALTVIKEIVDPSLVTRIGLRYGDAVLVEGVEELSGLVDSVLTYPASLLEIGTPLQRFSENLMLTESGILAIRTLCGVMPKVILDDPQAFPVKIDSTDEPSERMILDFDHFWECKDQSVPFDIDGMLERLSALHEPTRSAFWKLTSDYARDTKWN